jgi:hypothetical protein
LTIFVLGLGPEPAQTNKKNDTNFLQYWPQDSPTGRDQKSERIATDRSRIQEDVADDFVWSMLSAFRKARRWCKSSTVGEEKSRTDRRTDCDVVDFDVDDLKSKFWSEIANFNA